MNRKLRNTILAFSVTGMALAVGLLAAHPVLPDEAGATAPVVQAAAPTAPLIPLAALDAPGDAVAAEAASAPPGTRVPRYTPALVDAESLQRAVAMTVGFVVAIATGSTPADADAGATASGGEQAPATRTRRSGSVRSAIAVPYFSFARGAGRAGRS